MNLQELSCCYFPTTVLLVDDNQIFLANLSVGLDKQLSFIQTTQPETALTLLQKATLLNSLSQTFTSTPKAHDDLANTQPLDKLVNTNISSIFHNVYNANRFEYISLVMVDYNMPGMNGIEFCTQLVQQNTFIKKIMLTGEATHTTAVNAFNEGIIDKFIVKNTPTMLADINAAIYQLQGQAFHRISQPVIHSLASDKQTLLLNPNFMNFFNGLVQQKKIVEYYLLDATGSFLLLDSTASPTWLIVKSVDELEKNLAIAKGNQAPASIANALKKREKLPFFLTEQDFDTPVDKWESCLYEAKPLSSNEGYYYAVIEGNMKDYLDMEKIVSYKNYLHSLVI